MINSSKDIFSSKFYFLRHWYTGLFSLTGCRFCEVDLSRMSVFLHSQNYLSFEKTDQTCGHGHKVLLKRGYIFEISP